MDIVSWQSKLSELDKWWHRQCTTKLACMARWVSTMASAESLEEASIQTLPPTPPTRSSKPGSRHRGRSWRAWTSQKARIGLAVQLRLPARSLFLCTPSGVSENNAIKSIYIRSENDNTKIPQVITEDLLRNTALFYFIRFSVAWLFSLWPFFF